MAPQGGAAQPHVRRGWQGARLGEGQVQVSPETGCSSGRMYVSRGHTGLARERRKVRYSLSRFACARGLSSHVCAGGSGGVLSVVSRGAVLRRSSAAVVAEGCECNSVPPK